MPFQGTQNTFNLILQLLKSNKKIRNCIYLGNKAEERPPVSRNAGDKKNLLPGGRKFFLSIEFKFLDKTYTQRSTLTALFFAEKQGVLPFIV